MDKTMNIDQIIAFAYDKHITELHGADFEVCQRIPCEVARSAKEELAVLRADLESETRWAQQYAAQAEALRARVEELEADHVATQLHV
jgi:hypothetical protein